MPLPFFIVCELLEECHKLTLAHKGHARSVEAWFRRYRGHVDAYDTNAVALLSTLLPDKRTDRVYCIQAPRLEKIIGRGLGLGVSRIADLKRYREPGNACDLADCVERILNITPMQLHASSRVTVEEIDETLHGYASTMKWSSPSIRSQVSITQRDQRDLELLYQRFTPLEAKWFTRLVLKSFAPLCFDSYQIYRLCDPVLPSVLKIREDFGSAIDSLQLSRTTLLPNSTQRGSQREQILAKIKPELGIKVGRQHWMKARSIKHCLGLGHGRMSVEDKIDGEYCQIHIDLSKGGRCVQIFSKSGKDSTEDRIKLHSIIKDSLRVGKPSCVFNQGCIVEGELVVYDDLSKKMLPFHKIRNHVTRRGRFMNTEQDELPTEYEHLMIVYYDVLMLDRQSMLNVRHSERFKILDRLVDCSKGWAELVPRRIIDFGSHMAASDLRNIFAKAITSKQEGLVLKPDELYFDFTLGDRPMGARCIKLKKEYIGNFGDIGDFAAVGAGYDPVKAKSYGLPNLKWTHFYVGTLNNKEQVQRWRARPQFTVVSMVELNGTLLKSVVQHGNPVPVLREENMTTELRIPVGVEKNPRMTVAFTNPLVFDLRCFSFDKEGNTGFWTPRFPAVTKVHFDRDFAQCVSFDQLQELALENTTMPELPDSQENLQWIARLEGADPRGIAADASSDGSLNTIPTPSPCRGMQSPERQPTTAFAVKSLQLATPPNSSAPDEANKSPTSAQKSPDSQTRKRTRPNACSPQPLIKRPKSSHASTSTRSTPKRRRNTSPVRRPLMDIAGNSSQLSASFSSMEIKKTIHEVIDLTSSPEQSFEAPAEAPSNIPAREASFSQNSEEFRLSILNSLSPTNDCGEPGEHDVPTPGQPDEDSASQESELISVFPPDDTVFPDYNQGASTAEQQQPNEDPECKFVGTECQFANTCVILSPCLVNPPLEFTSLVEAHGFQNATMTIDEWIRTQGRPRGEYQDPGVPGKTLVLTDSIDHDSEIKSLMKAVHDHRSGHKLIMAYDWRVLRYISTLENKTKEKKYYHGFSDPWTRWYCGVA